MSGPTASDKYSRSAAPPAPRVGAAGAVDLRTRRCLQCDYPLIGLSEPRCPECGTAFDPNAPWFPERPLCVLPDGRPAGFFRVLWLSFVDPVHLARRLRPDTAASARFAWATGLWVLLPITMALLKFGLLPGAVAAAFCAAMLIAARICERMGAAFLCDSLITPPHVRPRTAFDYWIVAMRMGAGYQGAMVVALFAAVNCVRLMEQPGPRALGGGIAVLASLAAGYVFWLTTMVRMMTSPAGYRAKRWRIAVLLVIASIVGVLAGGVIGAVAIGILAVSRFGV